MSLLSTLSFALFMVLTHALVMSQSANPVAYDFYLTIEFEGSILNPCGDDVITEINGHALDALKYLMNEHKEAIGGQVIIDDLALQGETFYESDTGSRRQLPATQRTFMFRMKARCKMCPPRSALFDDVMGDRRLRGVDNYISLTDAIEVELNGMLGFALSDAPYKYECLEGATGVNVIFTEGDVY